MEAVRTERRRSPRFKVNKDVLSINQDVLAEVIDISANGMSCRCLTNSSDPLSSISEIELLNCESGTSIEGLPCRLVRSMKNNISDAFTSTSVLYFSLEFEQLNDRQNDDLLRFINDNSVLETTFSC